MGRPIRARLPRPGGTPPWPAPPELARRRPSADHPSAISQVRCSSSCPEALLGNACPPKLCFASGRGSDVKQSFAPRRSQAELGNEGEAELGNEGNEGESAAPKSRGTPRRRLALSNPASRLILRLPTRRTCRPFVPRANREVLMNTCANDAVARRGQPPAAPTAVVLR